MAEILKLGKTLEELNREKEREEAEKRKREEERRKKWEEQWGEKWEEKKEGIYVKCSGCFSKIKATIDDLHYYKEFGYIMSDANPRSEYVYLICPNCGDVVRFFPDDDIIIKVKEIRAYEERKNYLFRWEIEMIPGTNKGYKRGKLYYFIIRNFGIGKTLSEKSDWLGEIKIEKIDDKTIKVTTEKNFLSLRLNDEKTKVNLKVDDGRTDEFIAKTEKGYLNIYRKSFWERLLG